MNEKQPKFHDTRLVPHIRLDPPRQVLAIHGEASPVTILVDGSNAAFLTSPKINGRRQAKYETLPQVQDYLWSLRAEFPGVATEVLVDANLKSKTRYLLNLVTQSGFKHGHNAFYRCGQIFIDNLIETLNYFQVSTVMQDNFSSIM